MTLDLAAMKNSAVTAVTWNWHSSLVRNSSWHEECHVSNNNNHAIFVPRRLTRGNKNLIGDLVNSIIIFISKIFWLHTLSFAKTARYLSVSADSQEEKLWESRCFWKAQSNRNLAYKFSTLVRASHCKMWDFSKYLSNEKSMKWKIL